jgi:predicted SnoaL-like aldol condensation-catalyzing enzyme
MPVLVFLVLEEPIMVSNKVNEMKVIIIALLTLLFLNSCINRRSGKIKIINNRTIAKGDSIMLLNPFYTYTTFANEITCCDWYKPSKRQIELEENWDSIQLRVVNKYLTTDYFNYGIRNSNYNIRPFIFKFLIGSTKDRKSDSISYIMSNFSWNIRAGNIEEAYKFLPDSIKKLSYLQPIVVLTNHFHIYDIPFRAAYISGVTDLQFIPETFLIILKDGEIAYFRGYRRSIKYKKLEKNPEFINKFTHKLFDKL